VDGIGQAILRGTHVVPHTFHEQYQKNLLTFTIHDILHDTVLSLADEYIVTVVSSSRSSFIEEFLRKENLTQCFREILGVDIHPSKVEKINSLLRKYNIQPHDAVFITDTLGDIREANECGVFSIGVTWGLHDRGTLAKGTPKAIIDNPQELLEAVQKILH
jgi:phosphoglycolate phosphatase